MSKILVTTGIMRADATMRQIVVEFLNTSNEDQEIILHALNWNANTPVDLLAPAAINIPVGQIRVQFITAQDIFAYEVRVKIPRNNRVIVTSFAETADRTLIHGNTVLFPDFNVIYTCDSALDIPVTLSRQALAAEEVEINNSTK